MGFFVRAWYKLSLRGAALACVAQKCLKYESVTIDNIGMLIAKNVINWVIISQKLVGVNRCC
jgi:hypothetical protein